MTKPLDAFFESTLQLCDNKDKDIANFLVHIILQMNTEPNNKHIIITVNYEEDNLNNFLLSLYQKVIYYHSSGILTTASIFRTIVVNENIFEIEISEIAYSLFLKLKSLLLNYEIEFLFSLKSRYAIKLYLLIIVNSSEEHFVMPIEELQQELYSQAQVTYNYLKERVILPLISKINESGKIFVSMSEIKLKNKVTHIDLSIFKKDCCNAVISEQKHRNVFITSESTKKNKITTLNNITSEQAVEKFKKIEDATNVVEYFDVKRKQIQPNFYRQEYNNIDGIYLLNVHMASTGRTSQMFYDAITWLFSANKEAEFHRQYIMSIGKLIEKYNTLEHLAMYSKNSIKAGEEVVGWVNYYRKKGLGDTEILKTLQDGGLY